MKRRRISLASLATVIALTVSPVAGSLAPSAAMAADTPVGSLEMIVVTAQKFEQDLQQVPLSVDVLRDAELDMIRAAGRDILFLAGRSPSLYAESSSGRTFPRFYIRGLGNTDFDLNASQPVSLVYDEVVLENSILKGFPLFDMDRVEVLRGPQGTLFGRNTPAGVIKFESVKPGQAQGGYVRGSYSRFDTFDVEGAYGGPLSTDSLSARAAFLYQRRDDFVDNTFDGGEKGFEEFEEFAGRVQVLYEPDERFSALVNLHGRTLDGGSRLFRANIIERGTNALVEGFDLFKTAQDATQVLEVDNVGVSLKLDWQIGNATLTSVSAWEQVEITARGDVDGGFGADFAPPVGPGSIPFAAETADNITGHDQLTQELRLALRPRADLDAMLGAFVFYENLEIENLSFDTLAGGAVNGLAIQEQETFAWALFAAAEWRVAERWTLNGGLRLSAEDKEFSASRLVGPFGAPPLGPIERDMNDTVLSGDASVTYALADELRVYTRYARGFRAPSVQGRIVFGDAVTVADTETIDSIEFGLRSRWLGGRLTANATAFWYRTDDQQLTAVGGAGNFNQLLNANHVKGRGIELDLTWRPVDAVAISAGYSYNDTEIDSPGLEVGICAANVACTVLDPVNPATGNALIDGNRLPQAPEHIANLAVRYGVPLGNGSGELFFAGDVAYRSSISFFLYRSREFSSDDETLLGLRAGYVTGDGRYEFSAFGRNLLDERSINGGIDFNNLSGFVSDPALWGVEAIARF
jgi:iron complex outermembrane receptor protein